MKNRIPQFFNAAVLNQLNVPLEICSIQMPTPGYGQILVKMHLSGVCRSQLMEARGNRGDDPYLPHLMGHEGVGEVLEVGKGVTKVSIGDRVILGWIKGSGIDAGGSVLKDSNDQDINAGPVTTFSEYSLVSENRLTKCPEGISDPFAVLLGCALPTGAGMVLNQIKPIQNRTVALIGLGGIGISSLIMLRHFSPKDIVVIDIESEKLQLAEELGANDTYLSNPDSINALRQNYPKGFDYVIESAGRCDTIELAFELTHKQGICYFASHPPVGQKIKLDPHQLICGKTIKGTWGGGCNPDSDLERIAAIIKTMDIPISKLFSKIYSLNQINVAFQDLAQRKVIRAMVSFKNE